jgi:flagellar operon protein
MPEVNGINIPFIPLGGVDTLKKTSTTIKEEGSKSFDKVLDEEITRVKFSQHAKNRIETRKIDITGEDLAKLDDAVEKAKEKGAKESLILMRDMAFIVNIKSNTIVTALDGEQIKDNVFTNIDSVILTK